MFFIVFDCRKRKVCKRRRSQRNGWICDPRNINGQWLVCFDQEYDLPNIATIPVKEEDLKVIKESD